MGIGARTDTAARIEAAPRTDTAAAGIQTQWRAASARACFSVFAGLADAALILASALVIGWGYHLVALGEQPFNENLIQIGSAITLFFVLPNIFRQEYAIGNFLDISGHARRSFQLWNIAFICTIVLGFMTKTSMTFSRGTVALLYIGGFLAVVAGRMLLVRLVRISAKTGTISARRIFLVGFEDEIVAFANRHQPWNLGMQIVGVQVVPRNGDIEKARGAFLDATRSARSSAPDDVFILMGWDSRSMIDTAIDHFATIPASIHLGADPLLERFHDVRLERVGTVASVQVVRRPMSVADVALKRAFDIVVSAVALVLLAPLLAAIAAIVRFDSRGPAFFMQRRYGFNQQQFRIVKFRTMMTMDDGDVVPQAMRNDPRITRVGRFLRRWNLDELPQLVNVLRGDMSLVGPRPHALAHDHQFERRIALYARRHNVKPGITGLAQVNGFRGETSTDDKMRQRVELDLAYIDGWSIWLDMTIMLRTVFSPKSYRNAG
jgi:Undecaprenyl-phosphate glucose phosphotransferase